MIQSVPQLLPLPTYFQYNFKAAQQDPPDAFVQSFMDNPQLFLTFVHFCPLDLEIDLR